MFLVSEGLTEKFQSLFCWKVCLNIGKPDEFEGNEVCFNPYFAGRCALIYAPKRMNLPSHSFNPYFAGRCALIAGWLYCYKARTKFQSLFCWKVCLNTNSDVVVAPMVLVSILILLEGVP